MNDLELATDGNAEDGMEVTHEFLSFRLVDVRLA
jgi:hypothetical protein